MGGNNLNKIAGRELNANERPKAERHAKQRGMDLETYLENKHGKQAAELARQRDTAEYLLERQMERKFKFGKKFGKAKKYGKYGKKYKKYGGYGGYSSSSSDYYGYGG